MEKDKEENKIEKVYIIKPLWHLIFFIIGLIILLIVGILILFLTGLSSADDRVFAIEALIAGLITEFILKKWFNKELYLFPKLNIRFYYFWILLSAYVFLFQPFE